MTRFKQANHRFSLYESSADIDCLRCFLFLFYNTKNISTLQVGQQKVTFYTTIDDLSVCNRSPITQRKLMYRKTRLEPSHHDRPSQEVQWNTADMLFTTVKRIVWIGF